MKKNFTVPYMISGLLALSSLSTASTTATSSNEPNVDTTAFKTEIKVEAPDTAVQEEITPYATEAYTYKKDVVYVMNTGELVCRKGGTCAWRNNNPGNLVYSEFSREQGAIGKGAREFAVFPDRETGRKALAALLRTDKYSKLTVTSAIKRYAGPASEADLRNYLNHLVKSTGININSNLGSLNDATLEKVADAICVIEGWREGKIDTMFAMENSKLQIAAKNMQRTM